MKRTATTAKPILQILAILAILVQTIALNACSSGNDEQGGGGGDVNSPLKKEKISGFSQKGPFVKGSSITLFELDNNLAQTGKSFQSTITDDKGSFEINGISLVSPYVRLKVDGYYYNEISGEKSASPITLYAIADLTNKSSMNVNLLTHLEHEKVQNLVESGISVSEAKKQAQQEILKEFGIDGKFANSEDISIFGSSEGSAILLAISILLQGERNEANFTDLLADFNQSIKNSSEWSNTKKTQLADWALSMDLERIRANIVGWGLPYEVPVFEKYVRKFWADNYGLQECKLEVSGLSARNANPLSVNKDQSYVCNGSYWEPRESTEDPSSSSGGSSSSSGSSSSGSSESWIFTLSKAGESYADVDAKETYRQNVAAGIAEDIDLVAYYNIPFDDYIYSAAFVTVTEDSWAAIYETESDFYYDYEKEKIAIELGKTFYLFSSEGNFYKITIVGTGNQSVTLSAEMLSSNNIQFPSSSSRITQSSSSVVPSSSSIALSSSSSNAEKFYCDYGYPTTESEGGCQEEEDASACNLEWGVLVKSCGDSDRRTDLGYCDWGQIHACAITPDTPDGICGGCYPSKDISHCGSTGGTFVDRCPASSLPNFSSTQSNSSGGGSSSIVWSSASMPSSSSTPPPPPPSSSSSINVGGGGKGTFIDSRDGKEYNTVEIGTQTWMAKNLNYDATGSKCYDNLESNCDIYGRLYDWATAKTVCPGGWHLPGTYDWNVLMKFIHEDNNLSSFSSGTSHYAGKYLKAASGWDSNGNGTDAYGFAALPGGFGSGFSSGHFDIAGSNGGWWSASEDGSIYAYLRTMYYDDEYASWYSNYKTDLYSVRCLQD